MKTGENNEAVLVSIGEVRGSAGYRPLRTLIDRLAKAHPTRMYEGIRTLQQEDIHESFLTRIASINGIIAGVLCGKSSSGKFEGEYLFVDPKFARHAVGEKLIRSFFADHTEFALDPVPLSYSPGFDTSGAPDNREEALRRYYARLGFENIARARRMIWKKE